MGTVSYTTVNQYSLFIGSDTPANVTTLQIELWQGGGGGAGVNLTNNGGGGGGGYGKASFLVQNGWEVQTTIPAVSGTDLPGDAPTVYLVGPDDFLVTTADGQILPLPGQNGFGGTGGTYSTSTLFSGGGFVTKDGGDGHNASGTTSGGGGGSSAGTALNGVSATTATGATAPSGGGNGGNGGAALANGSNGTAPGGGGGGAGDGGSAGGFGGSSKARYTWTSITSNGGGTTANISVQEGNTTVTTVTVSGGGTMTYSLSGGIDQGSFSLNSSTGVLTFSSAPDYENPFDDDIDNIYEVQVQASDGFTSSLQGIHVTVTNNPADDAAGIAPANRNTINCQ